MRAISPFCSALFRRMPVCLFGAAALMFAVLTTPPALAGVVNVAPGSGADAGANYYERRCADVANNIANVPEGDYEYIVNLRNGKRLGAKKSSLNWFWGYNAKGKHVSYDGYCPEQKEWLAERGHLSPASSCPSNPTAELFRAAYRGKLERAKLLLSECDADVNARNNYNQTPLTWATRSGNVDMVSLLLDKEADVHARDKMGRTALHIAVIEDHPEMVDAILAHFLTNVNAKDHFGRTPMDWAAVKDNAHLAGVLKNAGGECHMETHLLCGNVPVAAEKCPAGSLPTNGMTGKELGNGLNLGARRNIYSQVCEYLRRGANVNSGSHRGVITPLHNAAKANAVEIAKLLISHGANVNGVRQYGFTPLYDAIIHNSLEMVDLLIANGADVNAKIYNGFSSLYWTMNSNNESFTDSMAAVMMSRLIKAGANANTPVLGRAAGINAVKAMKVLIANGADVNMRLRHDDTPLHMAAIGNSLEAAKLLLENGAEVNPTGGYVGRSPLYMAVEWNAIDVVELLLANGADVNALNDWDNSPLDEAVYRSGQAGTAIADILRAAGGRCFRYSADNPPFGHEEKGLLCIPPDEQSQSDEELSAQSDDAREDLTEVVAEGIDALPPSFNALATDVGFTHDMKMRLNARRDFRWDGGDWGLEAHIGAVGESDSQAAFTGVGGSKDFAGGWRVIGAAKVARGWTQLEGGLERGALWASEFSAGFERLGLFYGGDALGFGVSQPLYVEHWEAETADGRRFRGSQLSGRVLNVDASYRIPLPGGENGMMEFSAAVGRESGSASGFEGDALISAEWGF